MPAGARAAGDGHEEDRPERRVHARGDDPLGVEAGEGREVAEAGHREEDPHDRTQDADEDQPERDVVDRLGELPDREDGAQIAEGQDHDPPEEHGPLHRAVRRGEEDEGVFAAVDGVHDRLEGAQRPQPDTEDGDPHTDHGGDYEVFSPFVGHLARQDAGQGEDDEPERHLGIREEPGRDGSEGAHDQEQVEVEEGEEDRPGARRDELVAQTAHGQAIVAHGHDGRGVVLHPADEEHAQDQPEDGRQPAPLDGHDGPDDGPERRDGFELVAEQHARAGRHEIHAVVVHLGRRGLVRIGLQDGSIDAARVKLVAGPDGYDGHDDRYTSHVSILPYTGRFKGEMRVKLASLLDHEWYGPVHVTPFPVGFFQNLRANACSATVQSERRDDQDQCET